MLLIDFNAETILGLALRGWVVICLAIAALRRYRGSLLSPSFFALAAAPCILLSTAYPGLLLRSWRAAEFDSAVAQSLDAILTMVFGAASGVICARLAAIELYPEMDRKFLRKDDSTRQALHLIGSLGLSGCYFGWQATILISLLTGSLAFVVSSLRGLRGPLLAGGDWSIWVWAAVIFYLLTDRIAPSAWNALNQINPAVSYTAMALILLLLARLHARIRRRTEAASNQNRTKGRHP